MSFAHFLEGILAFVFLMSTFACVGIWLYYRAELKYWKDQYYQMCHAEQKRAADLINLRGAVAHLAKLANPSKE